MGPQYHKASIKVLACLIPVPYSPTFIVSSRSPLPAQMSRPTIVIVPGAWVCIPIITPLSSFDSPLTNPIPSMSQHTSPNSPRSSKPPATLASASHSPATPPRPTSTTASSASPTTNPPSAPQSSRSSRQATMSSSSHTPTAASQASPRCQASTPARAAQTGRAPASKPS